MCLPRDVETILLTSEHLDLLAAPPYSTTKTWIQMGNKSFETVEQFKYLDKTLTNNNSIHEKIKGRLNSWSSRYHSVHDFFCRPVYYTKI